MHAPINYARLFKTGQYGQLYITSSSHARGRSLRIQVIPKGEKAIPNGSDNMCLNRDAVEVYGVLDGAYGWDDTYGWIYRGKWQEDFYKLVREQEKREHERVQHEERAKQRAQIEKYVRQTKVLKGYE